MNGVMEAMGGLPALSGAPARRAQAGRTLLYLAAAAGTTLLAVVASYSWPLVYFDGLAYWRAGERLVAGAAVYQAQDVVGTPLAYWYPPPLAQGLAPLTAVIPELVFNWAWIALLVACLWWLVDGRLLYFLASLVFLPVAVELNVRNIHLPLAVLVALGLSRSGYGWLLGVGAAIKLSPGLGLIYLAARGRWRDALGGAGAAALICGASYVAAPHLWSDWISTMVSNGGVAAGASVLPIPYWVRAAAGMVIVLWAARQPQRIGDPVAAVAMVIALPTWWAPAFAMLLAAWKLRPRDAPSQARVFWRLSPVRLRRGPDQP